MLTDWMKKKTSLYLQLILQNFTMAQWQLFAGWRGDLHQPLTGRQSLAVGKWCHFHSHLALLSFAPPPAQQEQISPSLLCYPRDHATTASQEFLLRNYLPSKGKSLADNMSENDRFVCSVLCQSGEGDPAARLFCLWSLHGKGRYKPRIDPRIIKHLSSPCFPTAGGEVQGTVQGIWAGEVGWPLLSQKEIWLQI